MADASCCAEMEKYQTLRRMWCAAGAPGAAAVAAAVFAVDVHPEHAVVACTAALAGAN